MKAEERGSKWRKEVVSGGKGVVIGGKGLKLEERSSK